MNKELIKKRFGRKLSTYDENARIQKQMAEKLINMIPGNGCCKNILEIGCGTGLLTKLAESRLSFKNYTALDIVSECESFIKEINPEMEFVGEDIEKYVEETNVSYDLIISNASLQWVENIPEIAEKLIEKLEDGGTLLFSIFGCENFREICYIIGKTLPYLSKKELEQKLSKFFPYIEEEIRIMAFSSPLDVLKHIQNTGVNALNQESWTKNDLIRFENEYNSLCANHPTLTYNPIYVKIQKSI